MNPIAFYYRKDLNVIKHGEYKAAVNFTAGDAVYRDDAAKLLRVAANSAEFEGIVDAIRFNTEGNDTLAIESGERVRIGVGTDYEFVIKNGDYLAGVANNTEVGVANGKFVAADAGTATAVGRIVQKFDSGEVVVRIY